MFIGQVLKQKGLITEYQLNTALELQKDKLYQLGMAVPIGRVIVEQGYATEQELVGAINDHYNIAIESLSDNIKGLIGKIRGALVDEIYSPRIPIWFQLSLTMMLVLLLSIGTLSYVIFKRQRAKLYNQTIEMGMVSLNFFGSNASIPLLEENILALNTLLKNAEGVDGHLYAFIINNDKTIMAHTDQAMIGQTFKRFYHVDKVSKKGKVTYFNYVMEGNRHVLNMSLPILFKDKELGEVHVGLSIDFIHQLFLDEQSFLVFCTLIIVFVGLIVAVLFGLQFSWPISQLVKATHEIAKGNYGYRVFIKRKDEMGTLAKAFNKMGAELSRQALMKKSFGKYVGTDVLDMIMLNPENTWLKGRKKEATILFADIRGFTAYSETKDPEKLVEKLNEYFEIATRVILNHGGYIDKFIGDAVLGVFGVPVYSKDHPERCIRAALEMQEEFTKTAKKGNQLLSLVGIGIKSGVVVAGNIGSQAKMEYTVIGDSVNIASKLNAFAMPGEIIVDQSVCECLKDTLKTIPLAPQKIKGRSELVRIFKVIGLDEKRTKKSL
ncbi:MAG: HAMP domain-containing protein [Proteobacteria bacterium]|nr:HAMP domain-containing protein [Pseudomonadota bacterium]